MRKILVVMTTLLTLLLVFAPIHALAQTGEDQGILLRSESAVLMDADSGQILFAKDMQRIMYPASITKVVTAMLALQLAEPQDIITMSREAVFSIGRDTSHIALDIGEQITMEQALYAMAIASANDAANGIAEKISGTTAAFAELMNQAAREAGAQNTHFTNPHGLPDDDHVTTAVDMAKIAAAALKVPGFVEIFGSHYYEIPPTNEQPETRYLSSRNQLINGEKNCEGILFSKTGWTSKAEGTLVSAACREGVTLIAVVLKSATAEDKWLDTQMLFAYGFDQFSPATITKTDLVQKNVSVSTDDGDTVKIDFFADHDAKFLLPNDKSVNDVTVICGRPAAGPVKGRVSLNARLTLKGSDPADETGTLADMVLTGHLPAPEPTTVPSSQMQDQAEMPANRNRWLVVLPILILIGALGLLARDILKRRRHKAARQD
ncbi:MAG: D-alanyl-D-alanine carboxypeptidase family protein [Saccharofermentanales bacterium]|jgi:D-alanyl-D-alanine carboxypeptidase (penicillin-binding protein 5/6)|nr:D-alanyl-D-alanine carboxypeptidase [Clostridiaceae bacterium]